MRESLYTQVIVWVNTILNDDDTRAILPRYKGTCMVYEPEWYWSKNTAKYAYLIRIKKGDILIIDAQTVLKKRRYQFNTDQYHLLIVQNKYIYTTKQCSRNVDEKTKQRIPTTV